MQTKNNPQQKFLTTRSIAEQLEVSIQTVNNWIRRGWLSEAQFGRQGLQRKRVPLSELHRVRKNIKCGLPIYAGSKSLAAAGK